MGQRGWDARFRCILHKNEKPKGLNDKVPLSWNDFHSVAGPSPSCERHIPLLHSAANADVAWNHRHSSRLAGGKVGIMRAGVIANVRPGSQTMANLQ